MTSIPTHHPRRIARTVAAVVLAVGLVGVTAAAPTGSALAPVSAEASTLGVVPQSIARWLVKWVGETTGKKLVQGQGFLCLPYSTVSSCSSSYDAPRWASGRADTGGSAYYLRARSWTSTANSIVTTYANGTGLTIFCQTTGEWVYGRWGWTNVWDFIGMNGDRPMFVSDGFVYTGSNGFVAGSCSSTNYGGRAW